MEVIIKLVNIDINVIIIKNKAMSQQTVDK